MAVLFLQWINEMEWNVNKKGRAPTIQGIGLKGVTISGYKGRFCQFNRESRYERTWQNHSLKYIGNKKIEIVAKIPLLADRIGTFLWYNCIETNEYSRKVKSYATPCKSSKLNRLLSCDYAR